MGDVGFIDKNNRLWFCGRKSHLLKVNNNCYGPIPYENIINELDYVSRCALITPQFMGKETPTLIIQTTSKLKQTDKIKLEKNITDALTRCNAPFTIDKFIYKERLPVDGRHNIKIDRIKLKKEVENSL